MIDEKKLAELRDGMCGPANIALQCATWSDLADTLSALWKENAELKKRFACTGDEDSNHGCCDCFSDVHDKYVAVARAAELLNEREPKIADICGIAQALAALHAPGSETKKETK